MHERSERHSDGDEWCRLRHAYKVVDAGNSGRTQLRVRREEKECRTVRANNVERSVSRLEQEAAVRGRVDIV